ncbi:hypothetical protein [Streptococcus loxodontisalivarius]|uniref:Flagellar FliJ protein n=1 Tax=Streptococcus loxodontisalivarius TaxID=1349415 RepID=A0ABS2PTV1_9STRE|nr:hypothetical protein [Streptococcus loxodontisalivarius]MBM7643135.1 hypothetical protein [Streptococcus loxodontisalivarius]
MDKWDKVRSEALTETRVLEDMERDHRQLQRQFDEDYSDINAHRFNIESQIEGRYYDIQRLPQNELYDFNHAREALNLYQEANEEFYLFRKRLLDDALEREEMEYQKKHRSQLEKVDSLRAEMRRIANGWN